MGIQATVRTFTFILSEGETFGASDMTEFDSE